MENLYESITRDGGQSAEVFRQYAEVFYNLNKEKMFTTATESDAILMSADEIVNGLKSLNFQDEEREARMLTLGSIFGEALILALNGTWEYSAKQERWIIRVPTSTGEEMDLNIFSKLQKYWENGEVDSINYFYTATKALIHSAEQAV